MKKIQLRTSLGGTHSSVLSHFKVAQAGLEVAVYPRITENDLELQIIWCSPPESWGGRRGASEPVPRDAGEHVC